MTRRQYYAPIIARIITEHGGAETVKGDREKMAALRAHLRAAFPHPPRTHHPYKIWLDEIRYQLGIQERTEAGRNAAGQSYDSPGQMRFF